MSEEIIRCVECGRTFTWSYDEQRYFRLHKLEAPKRCPACRSHRRYEGATGTPNASARRTPSTTRPRATLPPASLPTSGSPGRPWYANRYLFYGIVVVILVLVLMIIALLVIQARF